MGGRLVCSPAFCLGGASKAFNCSNGLVGSAINLPMGTLRIRGERNIQLHSSSLASLHASTPTNYCAHRKSKSILALPCGAQCVTVQVIGCGLRTEFKQTLRLQPADRPSIKELLKRLCLPGYELRFVNLCEM